MAYSKNPHLARVRMETIRLVKWRGWSTRQAARYTGFSQSAIAKWCKKDLRWGMSPLPTESSRPKSCPWVLPEEIVKAIISKRKKIRRCSEVVHRSLLKEGIKVSLSSVKRTLNRNGLINKRSPWKRYHAPAERPPASKPGDLVQIDTIHFLENSKRTYVYTLLDLYSRWAYAWASERANSRNSLVFLKRARKKACFKFSCLQSDHGSEFSQHFTEGIKIFHRHSRVRKPNDNGHLERFNRTLQEEFLNHRPCDVKTINRSINNYLDYYNGKRLHMGIDFKTPEEMLQK